MSVLALSPERARIGDATAQMLSICGKPFLADLSGALYWPGERALLNRIGAAPVTPTRSPSGPIDPASALLGRSTEPSGFQAMRNENASRSRTPVGAEGALLGRGS